MVTLVGKPNNFLSGGLVVDRISPNVDRPVPSELVNQPTLGYPNQAHKLTINLNVVDRYGNWRVGEVCNRLHNLVMVDRSRDSQQGPSFVLNSDYNASSFGVGKCNRVCSKASSLFFQAEIEFCLEINIHTLPIVDKLTNKFLD